MAAYWTAENLLTPLRGNARTTSSINNAGEIVGFGPDIDGRDVGFYWPNGSVEPILLPRLDGEDRSAATGINERGVISGQSEFMGPKLDANGDPILDLNGDPILVRYASAILWCVANGQVSDPINLPSGDIDHVTASSLNNVDADGVIQVVGSAYNWSATSDRVAVTWDVLVLNDGTLLPSQMSVLDTDAVASGISDNLIVCGASISPLSAAVCWTSNGSQLLHFLSGATQSSASSINNNGTAVGYLSYLGPKKYGFYATVWPDLSSDPILLELFLSRRSPLITLDSAEAINAGGVIAGRGNNGDYARAFLATPK